MNRDEELKKEARRIHEEAVVIDTHSDTTMRMLDEEWNFMELNPDICPARIFRVTQNIKTSQILKRI